MTKTDKQREAFEKWAVTMGYSIVKFCEQFPALDNDGYSNTLTAAAYEGYQAATANLLAVLDSEEVMESVANALFDANYGGTERGNHRYRLAKAAIKAIKEAI